MSRLLAGLASVTLAVSGVAVAAIAQHTEPTLVGTATVAPLELRRFGRPVLTSAAVTEALQHGLRFPDRRPSDPA